MAADRNAPRTIAEAGTLVFYRGYDTVSWDSKATYYLECTFAGGVVIVPPPPATRDVRLYLAGERVADTSNLETRYEPGCGVRLYRQTPAREVFRYDEEPIPPQAALAFRAMVGDRAPDFIEERVHEKLQQNARAELWERRIFDSLVSEAQRATSCHHLRDSDGLRRLGELVPRGAPATSEVQRPRLDERRLKFVWRDLGRRYETDYGGLRLVAMRGDGSFRNVVAWCVYSGGNVVRSGELTTQSDVDALIAAERVARDYHEASRATPG